MMIALSKYISIAFLGGVALSLCNAPKLLASGGGDHGAKESGHGEAKKDSGHGGGHGEEKKDSGHGEAKKDSGHGEKKDSGHGGGHGGGHGEEKKEPAQEIGATRYYKHKWMAFPTFEAADILSGDTVSCKPGKGEAQVVIFVASWCQPCQLIMKEMALQARRFSKLYTRYMFVFAHDTLKDAKGFASEYQLGGLPVVLANQEILTLFKNPELPSIYVADRYGWLTQRYIKTSKNDLADLRDFLENMNAL